MTVQRLMERERGEQKLEENTERCAEDLRDQQTTEELRAWAALPEDLRVTSMHLRWVAHNPL